MYVCHNSQGDDTGLLSLFPYEAVATALEAARGSPGKHLTALPIRISSSFDQRRTESILQRRSVLSRASVCYPPNARHEQH